VDQPAADGADPVHLQPAVDASSVEEVACGGVVCCVWGRGWG